MSTLLLTTKTTSSRFPASSIHSESDVGTIVVSGIGASLPLRECIQIASKRNKTQVWASQSGHFFQRTGDASQAWKKVEFDQKEALPLLASAWLDSTEAVKASRQSQRLFPVLLDTYLPLNSSNIQLVPRRGSTTNLCVSLIPSVAGDNQTRNDDGEVGEEVGDLFLLSNPPFLVPVSPDSDSHAIYTTRNLDRIFVSKADVLQEAKPIPVPNRGMEKKFCTAEGTIILSDLKKCKLDFENGVVHFEETHAASPKDLLIWKSISKHGLKPDKLRKKLHSEASDSTLFGYAAAAVQSVLLSLSTTPSVGGGPRIDDVWKKTTSPLLRKVLTEQVDPFDEQVRLKDLYESLKEKHDLAIVGKTTSKIYSELRICLSFLRYFANAGKDYPAGW